MWSGAAVCWGGGQLLLWQGVLALWALQGNAVSAHLNALKSNDHDGKQRSLLHGS